MTFGEKIQKLRREAGLSQESFAEQLGVSRQAVSKWETDRGYPETEKMIRISKLFHVTLDYLLDDENAPAEGLEKNAGGMKPEEVRKCERSSGGESFGGECSAGPMDAGRRQGLYISRGTAEAFLLFQRAKWKKTGGAAGIFIAGLSFSFGTPNLPCFCSPYVLPLPSCCLHQSGLQVIHTGKCGNNR